MKHGRTYISEEPSRTPCPGGGSDHTPSPKGNLNWHKWATEMGKTHSEHRCPSCGLWAIWTPKVAQAA